MESAEEGAGTAAPDTGWLGSAAALELSLSRLLASVRFWWRPDGVAQRYHRSNIGRADDGAAAVAATRPVARASARRR